MTVKEKTKEKTLTPEVRPLKPEELPKPDKNGRKLAPPSRDSERTQVLIKAKELISDRNRWCQGVLHDRGYTRHCALGAIRFVESNMSISRRAAETLLDDIALKQYGRGMVEVNDDFGYGHTAVMRIYDIAISYSRELDQKEK